MNHGQKGIFTPIRNQPLTGRNANIQPTMFKRKQIFQKGPIQRNQTPFSGYSFTGSSVTDNSLLARSQVSDFSQQNVIKLIQQQLQKNGINSFSQTSEQSLKNKNQLNILRIEIRSIKQSYHELNKSFKKKIQDQNDVINDLRKQLTGQNKDQNVSREQLSSQLVNKIKQLEQDIAMKMRTIFSKMQQDLNKQLTNYANRQFIPIAFLDDLDKQLNQLDDRITNIQQVSKSSSNKQNISQTKIDKQASIVLSSNSQLKFNKLERDLEYIKKIVDQKSQKIKQIDQIIIADHQKSNRQIKQIKQYVSQVSSLHKQSKKQSENIKLLLQSKIQNYKKTLTQRIDQDIQALNKKIENQQISINQRLSSNIQGSFFKKTQSTSILTANNQNLTDSNKLQDTREQSKLYIGDASKKKQITQSPSKKSSKKITITYGNSQKQFLPINTGEQVVVQKLNTSLHTQNIVVQQQKKTQDQISLPKTIDQKKLYKVDKEGYLMDNYNRYILSSTNSMIRVSQNQIQSMQKTNLIKVERWSQGKQFTA